MVVQPSTFEDVESQIKYPSLNFQLGDCFYQFGRNPLLTLGELVSLFNQNQIPFQIVALFPDGAIIRSAKSINLDTCGSTLRKASILGRISEFVQDEIEEIDSLVEKIIFEHVFLEEKCSWTISTFNFPITLDSNLVLDTIKNEFKKGIKKQRIKRAFYIKGQETPNLRPRRLHRKAVLETGMEIILIHWEQQLFLGVTNQVIKIDSYFKRDNDRPFRRPLLLLGLAVARTMVNLSTIGQNHRPRAIYDPFCGMGSIVSEAYCLGYNGFGSDIDSKCMSQSQSNLEWIATQSQYHSREDGLPASNIFTMDITQPIPSFAEEYTGAIVAEPNLLTPQKEYPTLQEGREMMHEFEANYHGYFRGITKILKPGQIGVVIFPRIRTNQDNRLVFDYHGLLNTYHCKILKFTFNNVKIPAIFVHAWKKHIIEREIVVFQKI